MLYLLGVKWLTAWLIYILILCKTDSYRPSKSLVLQYSSENILTGKDIMSGSPNLQRHLNRRASKGVAEVAPTVKLLEIIRLYLNYTVIETLVTLGVR